MSIGTLLFIAPSMAILPLIGLLMPWIIRPGVVFGIRFTREQAASEPIARLKKRYAVVFILLIVPITAIGIWRIATIPAEGKHMALYIIGQIAAWAACYLVARNYARKIKATLPPDVRHEVAVADMSDRRRGLPGWFWWVPALAIVIGHFIYALYAFDGMPETVPLHFDLAGNPDRWGAKSLQTALLMPMVELFVFGLFVFVFHIIRIAPTQLDAEAPEASAAQSKRFRWHWSVFMLVSGTALIASMAYVGVQMLMVTPINVPGMALAIGVSTFGILVYTVILAVKLGQGGSRLKMVALPDGKTINRDDDRHWKAGIFYYNPDDPAVWVEKRFGIGWTLNFARRGALLFVLVISLLILGLVCVSLGVAV